MKSFQVSEGHSGTQGIALVPASCFSLAELAAAYNQARADYLVPMPMDENQLYAYILMYDIDLEQSVVAIAGGELLGLVMLGVRPGRTWITRLGVLPESRRRGTGERLLSALLENTRSLGCSTSVLEVIQGNQAAQALFRKAGFRETRDLLVMRRPPGPIPKKTTAQASWLGREEALARLRGYPFRQPWTNAMESYQKTGGVQGIEVGTAIGERGWLVFRCQGTRLSHFSLFCVAGDARALGVALGQKLYHRFPRHETYIENIPADAPYLGALVDLGFIEAFRRTEMVWGPA